MNPSSLPSTREAASLEVERLVKKFKALPANRRRLYNEAHRYVEQGHKKGNVVITVGITHKKQREKK